MSLLDRIKAKRNDLSRGKGERAVRLTQERNIIRILPAWDGTEDGDFFHDFGQHFIKDSSGGVKAVAVCKDKTFGQPCEVCEARAAAAASTTDEEILGLIAETKPSHRIIVNALYVNSTDDSHKTNPVQVELPPTVFNDILTNAENYLIEGVNIFDLKAGHNIIITKSGSGRNTEYSVTVSPKASEVPNAKDVMSRVKNLAEWVNQGTESDLARALTTFRTVTNVALPASISHARQQVLPAASAANSAPSRLAAVRAEEIEEADVVELPASRAAKTAKVGADEIDDFLADLDAA
jgi:hypothetical protein